MRVRPLPPPVSFTLVLFALVVAACGSEPAEQKDSGIEEKTCSVDCAALDAPPCQRSVCNDGTLPGEAGACVLVPVADGTACDDGNLCTDGDSCRSGACSPGVPKDCASAGGACTVGVCDPGTGSCKAEPVQNGTSCDDGDPCSVDDVCTDGACTGGGPKDCSAYDSSCTVGVCDPLDGGCSASPLADDTSCDDADACTTGETCKSGVCTGGAAVDCSSLDSECLVGVCNPAGGTCTTAPRATGTPCDDGDLCTVGDHCDNGVCRSVPKSCSSDPCVAGICDPVDGRCSQVPRAEGDACIPDPCTVGATCEDGLCAGGTPKDCSSLDSECTVGVCEPSSGSCIAERLDEPRCACPGVTIGDKCVYMPSTASAPYQAAARAECEALGPGWGLCSASVVCQEETIEYLQASGCGCSGGASTCACGSSANLYIHVEGRSPYYLRGEAFPGCMTSKACTDSVSEQCGTPLCCRDQ